MHNKATKFERYANPVVGEIIRRLAIDKEFVWGKGCRLRDRDGEEYLDFLAAYGALPLGHSPEQILSEIGRFLTSSEPTFVQPSALIAAGELAERLIAIAPGKFCSVTFQNSGAEAVEAAIKACMAATGRRRILAAEMSFHGKTLGALSATGSPNFQRPFFAPLDGFDFVPFGDAAALERVIDQRPNEYAAVILEPIQGEGGVNVPPPDYLAQVRQICDARGVLLIVDEIQTGLGRTGKLFASAGSGVQADCLLLAKALGGGLMPIAACLLSQQAYSTDFQRKHSSTFGGNSLACRVALRTLDVLTQGNNEIISAVAENGRYLKDKIECLVARNNTIIRGVRGQGYLIGIEFDIDRRCFEQYYGSYLGIVGEQNNAVPILASHLLNVGHVRVAPTLNGANTMRVEPPLIASKSECDEFLHAFEHTLDLAVAGNTGALIAHLVDGTPGVRRAGQSTKARTTHDLDAARFAFILHPLEQKNYAEFDESLAPFSAQALANVEETLNPLIAPFLVSSVTVKSTHGSAAVGDFIMVPRSAKQLAEMPQRDAVALVEDAINIARSRGARIVGLGGHTSIVTRGGLHVAGSDMAITTGNTYTMLTAVQATCLAVEGTRRAMSDVNVAVIGATGSIGSAMARLLCTKAASVTLVGNPASAQFNSARFRAVIEKIVEYIADTTELGFADSSIAMQLRKQLHSTPRRSIAQLASELFAENGANLRLRWSNDLQHELQHADVVVIATSSAEKFVQAKNVKSGAIVCDVSRPANVSEEIARTRPDVLVIDGGIVEAPGKPDLGSRLGIPPDVCYACMAETMMMALERMYVDTSLGLDLSNEELSTIQQLSEKHGFKLAGLRSFDLPLDETRWQQFVALLRQVA